MSSQSKDLDMLQVNLKEKLSKSKFLIVLDDVWNESYEKWEHLFRPFQFGRPGSRIIVTTRNDTVASVVGSPRTAYHMKLLTDDDCLSLLAQHARTSFDEKTELKEVGFLLVKKCKGLPLAAKTLGGLLRCKETKQEWQDVLNSKIWDLPEENNILPPNVRKRKEDLGLEYFNELLSRSFFQRLSGSDSNFVMHDLINDLAQFVAGGTCYRLDEKMDTNQEYRVPEKTRHGSFLRHEYELFRKFRAFYQFKLKSFISKWLFHHRAAKFNLQLDTFTTLPKIVLGKVGDLGLRELRNLTQLRGRLAIFELQNVTDIEDVKEASLISKEELDELQLTWGSDINTSQNRISEEEVIDLLQPHDNLKNLKLEFYRGSKFPSWIGDPAFRKLSSISFSNCSECTSLPPLGQLPELKHLRIGGMPKVKSIGTEFYGSGVVVPFAKLETLRFDNMPKWEKWTAFADGVQINFPHLHQLAMFRCGKLTNISPLNFPSLRELDLEKCNKVLLESFSSLDSLNYLKVEGIAGLSHLPTELTQSLAALEVLECCNCDELLSVWPNEIPLEHLAHLRRLVVADCSQLVSLGQGEQQLPCNLEVVELFSCPNFASLPNDLSNLRSLREMIIKNCIKFISFPENGIPPMLKRLEILSCNALESLPSNISDLERLEIKDCSSLKSWSTGNFPIALKKFAIKNCTQLDPVSETMFPDNSSMLLEDLCLCNWMNFSNLLQRLNGFSHLVELYLSSCYGLKHFPEQGLPPSLRALSIEDCASLKSLPKKIRAMKSLVSLEIRSCPRLDKFPKHGLPPNLSSLRIWDSKKFMPLTEWGLHRLTSLREFSICGGFKELELLSNDDCLFPPSLIKFSIARFPALLHSVRIMTLLDAVVLCGEFVHSKSTAIAHLFCIITRIIEQFFVSIFYLAQLAKLRPRDPRGHGFEPRQVRGMVSVV
ncbi:UNVERIFIED_CONTAM: putative disease resistance protein RGA3 [Sesamum radiatum]|uniref:Disease resistance protein RGA3 n=1 Tax=Sesamum radiatum TaxID=300843 RepID=A0AAW2VN57_SESRA